MKVIQIVPHEGGRLYDDLVKKEGEIRKSAAWRFNVRAAPPGAQPSGSTRRSADG